MITPFAARCMLTVAVIVLVVAGVDSWLDSRDARAYKLGYSVAKGEAEAQTLKEVRAARTEEARKTKAVQEKVDDARQEILALNNAMGDSERSAQRLRERLAAAQRALIQRAAAQPAPAGGSPPADPAEGVLADVYRRYDEAALRVERYADEARIAGRTCERAYDSLQVNE